MSEKEEEKVAGANDAADDDKIEADIAENLDEMVFSQNQDLLEEVSEKDFSCSKPKMHNSHIIYYCKGIDKNGAWVGDRRYNEFYKLHEKLC
jgi:hypothetical protein